MPNQLSASKIRISYAESLDVRRGLESLAKKRGVTLSDLVKEATEEYLNRRAPEVMTMVRAFRQEEDVTKYKSGKKKPRPVKPRKTVAKKPKTR